MMLLLFKLCLSSSFLTILSNSYSFQPLVSHKHLNYVSNSHKLSNNQHNKLKYFKLQMQPQPQLDGPPTGLTAWLSPNTRGGVIVWSIILIAIPYTIYSILVAAGLTDTEVGAYVGSIFVLLSCLLWASTYVFRVATKDMTYAQQLRDYENAVLQKRLEELADDEIQALMEEIEVEDSKNVSKPASSATPPLSPETL